MILYYYRYQSGIEFDLIFQCKQQK